ncbi:hypothetical protein G7Y89_g6172 [Cudoniella acicularis]|uniref:Transmembrane protein n=1 Tax=Cudoniella acicularis TaxID=354080 RepID=A0A8H4RN97_9HELO|nr:hypothetical protein G7Y89_g6172 [Cudoniella acicularis]
MSSRRLRSRRECLYSRSTFPFSSTFLFLSIVLPTSSFAQLTDQPSAPTRIPSLTTLLTSSISPSPSIDPATPTLFSTAQTPGSGPGDQEFPGETHVFNYYFLIVALVAVLFCICILYIGRRKKRKAALLRRNSQRALAQDVAGFRTRFGRPRNYNGFGFGLGAGAGNRVEEREEGLDERGEAPPPYVPGSKPPSLRSVDVVGADMRRSIGSHTGEDTVELSRLSADGHNQRMSDPPGYSDAQGVESEDISDIARPPAALTISQSFASTRRLLSSTGDSSHA